MQHCMLGYCMFAQVLHVWLDEQKNTVWIMLQDCDTTIYELHGYA